ncbi:MAG TPA: hypothetical protein VE263_17885 [Candidatus Angelobacter sp.]|nr:hypothetical protein [Candidatus Angelobacter sp.]
MSNAYPTRASQRGALAVSSEGSSVARFGTLASQLLLLLLFLLVALPARAQDRAQEEEIVANLAGGRVIVHVARDLIIFAAIDQPVEQSSVPPRVVAIDGTHIGVLFGASDWRMPADPKPVRLDRNFQRVGRRDSRYETDPEGDPDLEVIGEAFLEKLRPLVGQLHHKVDFSPEAALFEVVIIGYAPNNYGPEVWTVEYRIEQEEIATRGEFWQTRVLRPRFTQLYPPEKHAPRTLVEIRYPAEAKGPTLHELIKGNDPRITPLGTREARFEKVLENLRAGSAQKAAAADSVDFMRAVLPLIAGDRHFFLGTVEERSGFNWVVPPDEPVEKAEEDKNRPPDAPTLRPKIKP